MIQAVIFDMDGLLVDSEPVWDKARAAMAARLGKCWSKSDHEAVMGVSTQEWVNYMVERLEPDMPPEEVQEEVVQSVVALYKKRIPFMPFAVKTVGLVGSLYPTALASGSVRKLIEAVTSSPSLAGMFEVILSADEVARGKPHPDVYIKAAELLGVNPGNCICVEDSGNGILAGKRAGMKVIAVPDGRFPPKPEKLTQADVVLESLEHVTQDLLESLG